MTSESPLLLSDEERTQARLEAQLDHAREEVARLEWELQRVECKILFKRSAIARSRLWWK